MEAMNIQNNVAQLCTQAIVDTGKSDAPTGWQEDSSTCQGLSEHVAGIDASVMSGGHGLSIVTWVINSLKASNACTRIDIVR